MKITDFADLISNLPVNNQAFDIKYDIWKSVESNLITQIFNRMEIVSISRNDIFQSKNIEEQVVKILMWGYPTKGRGKNIDNFLQLKNFTSFLENLKELEKQKRILLTDIQQLLKETNGLGFSTFSKILYFRKINIESYNSLILDIKVINALKSGRFEDTGIKIFKNLRYDNAVEYYAKYLDFMDNIARQIKTEPDKIEMFLFEFGLNLKKMRGE